MQMFTKLILAVSVSALLLPVTAQASQTMTCTPATKSEIAGLFDRWNSSLKTGDATAVAANYAADAVLLPTLSNTPRLDNAARIDYFEHFLQKKPQGTIDSSTINIGCNKAFDTGTYTFTFADKSSVQARYTFTYALLDDQWRITSHHSSAMPEKPEIQIAK